MSEVIHFAKKLPPGKTGKSFRLTTNNVSLKVNQNVIHTIYQYDVSFDPPIPAASARREVWTRISVAQNTRSFLAYDGTALAFSIVPLEGKTFYLNIIDESAPVGTVPPPQPTDTTHASSSTPTPDTNTGGKAKGKGKGKGGNTGAAAAPPKKSLIQTMTIKAAASISLKDVIGKAQPISSETSTTSDLAGFGLLLRNLIINQCLANIGAGSTQCKIQPSFYSLSFISTPHSIYAVNKSSKYLSLGSGVYGLLGLSSSLRQLECGLTLNIDRSYAPTVKASSLLEFIKDALDLGGGGGDGGRGGRGGGRGGRGGARGGRGGSFAGRDSGITDLSQAPKDLIATHIRGLTVHTTHLPRYQKKLRLMGCGPRAGEVKFKQHDTGKQFTMVDYFRTTYNINIDKNMFTVHSNKPDVFYPVEVLTVPTQEYRRELNVNQQTVLIESSSEGPADRLQNAKHALTMLTTAHQQAQRDIVAVNGSKGPNWNGIEISPKFIDVNGRVILPPQVLMGTKTVDVQRGDFRLPNGGNFHHITKAPIQTLLLHATRRDVPTDILQAYVGMLISLAKQRGVTIVKPPSVERINKMTDVEQCLNHYLNPKSKGHRKIDLILCVADSGSPFYAQVKRIGEFNYGIPSQFADSQKLFSNFKSNDEKAQSRARGYVSNILLKVNMKLGGLNYTLNPKGQRILAQSTMVFGIDVCHGNNTTRSHSAFVGSVDSACTTYICTTHQQGKREEIIPDIVGTAAFTRLLLTYYQKNKSLPTNIVVYRDGLADSQLSIVLDVEVRTILKVLPLIASKLGISGYSPKLLYVTAVKRHNTRFQPDKNMADQRTGNTPSGTVIDTGVVRPDVSEFYLHSSAGLLGTSRPTFYQVVYNQGNFTMDDIQSFTFYLAHTHQRCTKAVSIPAPVYYAHLLAYRARYYDPFFGQTPPQPARGEAPYDATWKGDTIPDKIHSRSYYL